MRRKVKEDRCFHTAMGRVQKRNLPMQGSSNQNREGRSQTKRAPPESAQQHFQNICHNQVPGPLDAARKLHELCFQWLMPETSFEDQILDSLVLEQFLSILPQGMRNWMQKHHPGDVKQTVSLVESLQKEPDAVPDKDLLTFDDIDMRFSEKEWRLLDPSQKALYSEEMLNMYKMAASLGLKPENGKGNDQPESASTSGIEAKPSKVSNTRKKAAQNKNSRKTRADTLRAQKRGQAHPRRGTVSASGGKKQVPKRHQCQECKKFFRVPAELVRHHRVHTREKPFPCQECDRRFRWMSDLTAHSQTHKEIKLYTCSWCQKSFSLNTNLHKHQRIHTGEKPYKCLRCERAFTQKCILVRHQVVHTKEKPYSCSLCETKFTRQSSLVRHQKTRCQATRPGGGQSVTDCRESHDKNLLAEKIGGRYALRPRKKSTLFPALKT
ncbi:hypothetical protein ACRRTK_001780 [Alexandromys fortis]